MAVGMDLGMVLERLERLEAENAELRRRVTALDGSSEGSGGARPAASGLRRRMSRRTLLRDTGTRVGGAALGAVAAMGATLGAATAVRAAGDDGDPITVGGTFTNAQTRTLLRNSTNGQALLVLNHQATGGALEASTAGGVAVAASSSSGFGVIASSTTGTGLDASSEQGVGANVVSEQDIAVKARSSVDHAVLGRTLGKTAAIRGESGVGCGVLGFNGPFSTQRPGPKNVGVHGASVDGRGGTFDGKLAAVRLMPSTAATHPTSGSRGDLFVDASGRLWYSRGGTAWVRLDD